MRTRLFFTAIIPGIALILGLYLTDRYDREPLGLLVKVFSLGALSVIPVFIVELILSYFNFFSGIPALIYEAFILAGLTEEFFKRKVVLITAYKHKAFNEKLDGIIYCTYSALGFATIENIVYVLFRYVGNPYVGIFRGIFSVPGHVLFGVTMGYYLSLAKFSKSKNEEKKYLRLSLFIPMIFHGTFNFILTINRFVLPVFILFVIYLWVISLRKLNRYYIDSKIRHRKRY